jgi:hypothetical protein
MSRERGGTLTRPFRVAELLEEIEGGGIVLPEFQRDFEWSDERVSQLLATVARRWPAGSLLLQDFPGETFYSLRPFEGGPSVRDDRVQYVVLDGQQRLTALYHAVYDTGPYVYAIRASALTPTATIDGLEEAIESFSRPDWDRNQRDRPWQSEHDWIPFYALRSAADFFGWRDEVVSRSPDDLREHLRDELSDAYRHGLEAFHSYQLPAVIVERELEPAAIARIFERVNRGGLTLSAFDLMVAKTFETGWNLRDRWDQAQSEYPILTDLDDGMPIIRVIALKASSSVREADVLRLNGLAVRQDWDCAVRACAAALTFMREHCGVRQPEWLPYGGMVITLAALAFEHELGDHRDLLVSWFFSRAFGLRYEGGANTVTVDQYNHLCRVVSQEASLERVDMVDTVVREATRKRRSAIWRAFMCALSVNGALDPLTAEVPDGRQDAAHLLPRDPAPPPDTESSHLLVLNLLLVDATHVGRLNGIGLAGLRALLGNLEGPVRDRVLTSQFLPDITAVSTLDEFLDGRLARLDWFLKTHVGYGLARAEAPSPAA